MRHRLPLAAILLCLLALPSTTHASWPLDGAVVAAAALNQSVPEVVSDGAGGAIIVWEDFRTGSYAIHAQRIDALGVAQWTANGVAVSTPSSDRDPVLIPDGAGGAIIAWSRNGDLYAQRLNSAGAPLWGAGGVVVSNFAGAQQVPSICSDNTGGAIIAWQDTRGGADYDIFAQRVNSAGVPQWAANGVPICVVLGSQQSAPQIAADGSGGALIAWPDTRSGASDIYVQRLGSNGIVLWAGNGVGICTAADTQTDPSIIWDTSGGAYVAWEDNRSLQWDVYIRRINFLGTPQWAANGVAVSALANFQNNPVLLPDGVGGAFIAWDDGRSGITNDIYVQRYNLLGTAAWAANGVALAQGGGYEPAIVTDGLGGAIVAWHDLRSGSTDIYARRINGSGVPQWSANGTALCTAPGTQQSPSLATDGAGGAIVVWEDARIPGPDIYAQRIERNGYWGYPSPDIVNVRDVPGDQGGLVSVAWDASRLDPWPDEAIETYTVWRALEPSMVAAVMAAGENVRVQEINATTYYWQLIHTLGAYGLTGYSDLVPTPFDSTASSQEPIYFQVIAHATGNAQWISEPASGRSLDNLAPIAPLALTAQRVGSDVHLIWNQNHELDLDHYSVYRHTASGVTPIPAYFLSSPDDTVMTDANAPNGALYYIVTAIDSHDNQSAKSNEASVSPVTGVDDSPKSHVLSVSNYPNPFNPRTTVSYSVPARGPVTVAIYDARGALVATLLEEQDRAAGAYTLEWDGHADNGAPVGSGIYFARIEHNGVMRSKKMVLLK